MGHKINDIVTTGGFPFYLMKPIMDSVKIQYFIETGTAGGLTIMEAAKHFRKCWTIELIEGRAKVDTSIHNIEWITGDSEKALLPIVNELISEKNSMQIAGQPAIYNYAMFWLDSHYSDPQPNTSEYKECPLLEELAIISAYQDSAIIVIDDARLFYGPPPAPLNPTEWPRLQDIFALLNEKFPYNTHTIRDDYIISLPERLNEPFDAEWRGNYTKRYPTHQDSIRQQTKNVFAEFKKYIDAT